MDIITNSLFWRVRSGLLLNIWSLSNERNGDFFFLHKHPAFSFKKRQMIYVDKNTIKVCQQDNRVPA